MIMVIESNGKTYKLDMETTTIADFNKLVNSLGDYEVVDYIQK